MAFFFIKINSKFTDIFHILVHTNRDLLFTFLRAADGDAELTTQNGWVSKERLGLL